MHVCASRPKATQQFRSPRPSITRRNQDAQSPDVTSMLHLQRTIGNQAAQRMLQTSAPALIQPKLAINEPGDRYEQEADRVAGQVMRAPEPRVQRACACGGRCPKCQKEHSDSGHERVQRVHTSRVQAGGAGLMTAPATVHKALRSPGQPFDPATRAFMEPRFGFDFSHVRVHLDDVAAESARDVNAQAYTVGHNIVFGANRFAPHAHEGRRLIAHELTHVMQQSHGAARIQRGPSDTKSPKADAPVLGGSKSTSDVVVLYHYGDLEGRREIDAKTTEGAPFKSSPGYPRLTDCDSASCQREVTERTGTPQNEKIRHKYELRIDRAYFDKHFRNTGTRGAYSEYVAKDPIPMKYLRRVSSVAPTTSAPPTLPARSGTITVKPPAPVTPIPAQRGKVVTATGGYQEVLSGEVVKGSIGGAANPPKPTGGNTPAPPSTGGAGGGGGRSTAKISTSTGTPTKPVVEATRRFRPGGSGMGSAIQMLQAWQFGNLQQAEVAKFQKRLAELQPKIDAFLDSGYSVELLLIVEKPNRPDVLCAGKVFCDQGQLIYFRTLYITRVESMKPVVAPRQTTSHATMSAPGGRDSFIPYTHQGGSIIEEKEIKHLTPRNSDYHCEYAKQTLYPQTFMPFQPSHRPPPVQPEKPRPKLDPEVKKAMALAPSRVYMLSENIVQYRTVFEIMKKLATNAQFGQVTEYMGGGQGRTRTAVFYRSDLDKARAEMLAEIIRAEGVATARAERTGDGEDAPGTLQAFFGSDAEKR